MEVNRRIVAAKYVVLAAVAISISGCENASKFDASAKPKYAEDAANVYVSAYPAVPWTDIAEKLEPNHKLKIEDARKLAIQASQTQQHQIASIIAATAGVKLPEGSRSAAAETETPSNGKKGEKNSSDEGKNGSSSSSDRAPGIAVDANTLLTATTALYQQAQILDNQIGKGVLPEGYQAHMITFQVNVQPKQRNVSYDAYMDVSLLPASWSEALNASKEVSEKTDGRPPVMVYPLIITDALETTNVARSIEVNRKIGLGLSAAIQNIGVDASGSGKLDRLNNVSGFDKNSLVTAGRVSDHAVRVRIGAENSGSVGLTLTPRSYNVSLVALTRWDKEKRVTSLQAIANTTLISTEDGSQLESRRRRPQLAKRVCDTVKSVYASVDPVCAASVPPTAATSSAASSSSSCDSLTPQEMEANLDLLRAADRADYNRIVTCLKVGDKPTAQEVVRLHRLLAQLMEVQVDSRYSKLLIALQKGPELPDTDQVALYSDDNQTTSVFLRGGKGLNPRSLKAALYLQDGKSKILSSQISLMGDGSGIKISFPSLSQMNLSKEALDARPLFLAKDPADGETSATYAMRELKSTQQSPEAMDGTRGTTPQ